MWIIPGKWGRRGLLVMALDCSAGGHDATKKIKKIIPGKCKPDGTFFLCMAVVSTVMYGIVFACFPTVDNVTQLKLSLFMTSSLF